MILVMLMTPVVLQALAMAVDEFYFHWRRGLPAWERVGHPLDTVTVLATFAYVGLTQFSQESLLLFAGLALFSCFVVTKDEFVHARLCSPGEQWLHGVLFFLHPLVFVSLGFFWVARDVEVSWLEGASQIAAQFVRTSIFVLSTFLLYQASFWGLLWKRVLRRP